MSVQIQFLFNGQLYEIPEGITLDKILYYFQYTHSLCVLEYNNMICNKEKWNKIYIQEKDKIEVITIVGGG